MTTIESKVYAATLGSGAGTILSGFILWLLGITFWHAGNAAGNAAVAAASVPAPVAAVVVLGLSVLGAFLGGYRAPHTARPDLAPSASVLGVPAVTAPPAIPLFEHFPDPAGVAPAEVAPTPAA